MTITAKWDEGKTGVSIRGDVNGFIPRDAREWFDMGIDKLEESGLIEAFRTDDDIRIEKELEERNWRDSELSRMDIEINKKEDNGLDASSLRQYRNVLRAYPERENFPYCGRPSL